MPQGIGQTRVEKAAPKRHSVTSNKHRLPSDIVLRTVFGKLSLLRGEASTTPQSGDQGLGCTYQRSGLRQKVPHMFLSNGFSERGRDVYLCVQ